MNTRVVFIPLGLREHELCYVPSPIVFSCHTSGVRGTADISPRTIPYHTIPYRCNCCCMWHEMRSIITVIAVITIRKFLYCSGSCGSDRGRFLISAQDVVASCWKSQEDPQSDFLLASPRLCTTTTTYFLRLKSFSRGSDPKSSEKGMCSWPFRITRRMIMLEHSKSYFRYGAGCTDDGCCF